MTPTFRPITPDDDEFLYELYASTRTAELAVVPWSDSIIYHRQSPWYRKNGGAFLDRTSRAGGLRTIMRSRIHPRRVWLRLYRRFCMPYDA
jgi:hypothetical protein